MSGKRLTIENPRNHPMQKQTFHIPMHWVGKFRMETIGSTTYMYGDIADKLGRYEELGEPEEIAQRLGIRK